jgi:hypothetical protein
MLTPPLVRIRIFLIVVPSLHQRRSEWRNHRCLGRRNRHPRRILNDAVVDVRIDPGIERQAEIEGKTSSLTLCDAKHFRSGPRREPQQAGH